MTLFEFADFLGIVAFALAGILAAQGKKVDPVGVFVLAFTTAFGGGLIRDVIIDNRPFYWIAHQDYVWLTLGMSLIAPFIVRKFGEKSLYTAFVWSDAIGLAVFSVGGTALSLKAGLPYLPATMLGVCTGVFGGLIRDVFLCRLPMVLSDKLPYAVAAFTGTWLYIGMVFLGIDAEISLSVSSVFIVAFRMVCWYKDLQIVRYSKHHGTDGTL